MHDICADSEDELGCYGQALPMVVGSKVGKLRLFHHLYVLSLHVYTHTHTHTHHPSLSLNTLYARQPTGPRPSSPLTVSPSLSLADSQNQSLPSRVEWFPQLNKVGRKKIDHDITEPLPPVLIQRYLSIPSLCLSLCLLSSIPWFFEFPFFHASLVIHDMLQHSQVSY